MAGYARVVPDDYLSSPAPQKTGWRPFLGLEEERNQIGLHVRRGRLIRMRRDAVGRVLLSLIAIILLSSLRLDELASGQFTGWALSVIILAILANAPYLRPIGASAHIHARSEAALALGMGVLWATGMVGFFSIGARPAQLDLTLIYLFWIVGSVSLLAATPLAALALAFPAGAGLVTMFVMAGQNVAAALGAAVVAVILWAGMRHAQSFYRQLLDDAARQEHRDMLGLVLREFDESGGNWVWEIDASRGLKNVSPRFADALGKPAELLEGCSLLPVLAGSSWDDGNVSSAIQDLAEKLRKRERFSGLLMPFDRGGETRWWELSALPSTDATGTFSGFRGLGCDVTEAHRAVDRINRMAKFDALTGLPNRLHLLEELEQAIIGATRQRTRCAVLLIDLDRFKAVNDTFGHPVGDQLLTLVGARLRALSTKGEVFGRLGGDEFAAVMPNVHDPAQVATLAHRIVESLSAPYEVNRHRLVIGASVGAAVSPRDGRTADMLMRSADLALYESKEAGRGRFRTYEPRFLEEAEERRLIEIAFQNALEAHEFSVTYRPILDTASNEVLSLEAELRWESISLGEVAPARFIPIAQDTQLIIPVGDWLLKEACQTATAWQNGVSLTVRVTAEQLIDSGMSASIVQALTQSGLPAQRLTIDVSEDALMRAGDQGLSTLDQISTLGVRLSLSEFGPSGAALGHFTRSRFSAVRLHPTLIRAASDEDRKSLAMLKAVMALADNLGLAVIAQGIETEKQFNAAQSLGCHMMQGPFFGSLRADGSRSSGWHPAEPSQDSSKAVA